MVEILVTMFKGTWMELPGSWCVGCAGADSHRHPHLQRVSSQDFRRDADSLWVRLAASDALLKYIVPKGYVAVDGTSLTVVDVRRGGDAAGASASTEPVQLQPHEAGWFSFMLVSHTQQCIVMPSKTPGSRINIEVDVMGKYVEAAIGVKGGSTQPPAQRLSPFERYAPLVLSSAALVLSATALLLARSGKKQ